MICTEGLCDLESAVVCSATWRAECLLSLTVGHFTAALRTDLVRHVLTLSQLRVDHARTRRVCSLLKMEAVNLLQKAVNFYHPTQCHIPGGNKRHSHRSKPKIFPKLKIRPNISKLFSHLAANSVSTLQRPVI